MKPKRKTLHPCFPEMSITVWQGQHPIHPTNIHKYCTYNLGKLMSWIYKKNYVNMYYMYLLLLYIYISLNHKYFASKVHKFGWYGVIMARYTLTKQLWCTRSVVDRHWSACSFGWPLRQSDTALLSSEEGHLLNPGGIPCKTLTVVHCNYYLYYTYVSTNSSTVEYFLKRYYPTHRVSFAKPRVLINRCQHHAASNLWHHIDHIYLQGIIGFCG